MSNPQAHINNTINAGNPATLPTHCFIATHTGTVVPVPQDPPAPNVMDPALRIGLYNPNPYVRGIAMEPIAKMGRASVMRRAEAERSNAREFVRRLELVKPDEPASPAVLTNEELAAYEELVDEERLEGDGEEEEAKERGGGEGGPAEKQQQQQQQKKKKQAPPEPKGTAWFVQRGKELDSKRI